MIKQSYRTVELDVRPYLREKIEPFKIIMDTVKSLEMDDVFVLHATFKPTPLLGVLKMRGFVNKVEKKEKDHWIVTFVNKKNRHLLNIDPNEVIEPASVSPKKKTERAAKTIELDNRGLEPPQPMMRTLAALDRSQPGDQVLIHNDRVPVFLIEELNGLGYPFHVEEQTDGTAKVKIQKV
ncbi:DUF2249 domain-containing protein [Bacillus sp. FJAT-50079]|uniref:DUF2249 domain-containing protein n=1 Tax=Bacillus sp. FJAT-50079 TaxID=2833577 RepID=UPI001BCA216A|nr:DUF2249 domain-containing protein [Bacillus sp. FJAT-50079]MBS4209406.1 DUF2249 domain-containing protein [Bacillus sp. FJAT-50079]